MAHTFTTWNAYVNNRKIDSAHYLSSMSKEDVTKDMQVWADYFLPVKKASKIVVRKARK
jgi:hypothetical protein